MKNVTIMMGVPGGGKSTWIRNNVPSDAVICSADHFFEDAAGNYNWKENLLFAAHCASFGKFVRTLDDDEVNDIVVDNTNTKRAAMRDYVREANKRGISVTIVAILADPNKAHARNVHGVPLETIQKMNNEIINTLNIGFPPEWDIKKVIKVG